MSFLKGLFGSKAEPIQSYADFWNWFESYQTRFYKIISSKDVSRIERDVFAPLSSALGQIKDGFFFLAGMLNDSTAELVLTADGNPKNIVFVEELVDSAPDLPGWKFTALKQPVSGSNVRMNKYEFGPDTMSFYPNDHPEMPDLVDITIVHDGMEGPDADAVEHGAYIYLDHLLGELNFLTGIDDLRYCGPSEAEKRCIPIEALPNFLETRQALFVEKYAGIRANTDDDNYSFGEGQTKTGRPWIAMINTDLMKWDKKASHPWMFVLDIPYAGDHRNGLPDPETAEELNKIEHAVSEELKDEDGYLNIGRETANNERHVFFACVDFRKPSKVAFELQRKYKDSVPFTFEIFRDKYWQAVNHFQPQENSDSSL
jgi:hypothetical protein